MAWLEKLATFPEDICNSFSSELPSISLEPLDQGPLTVAVNHPSTASSVPSLPHSAVSDRDRLASCLQPTCVLNPSYPRPGEFSASMPPPIDTTKQAHENP